MSIVNLEQAVALLKQGEVIAYPTEAVFGLGCDPDCETAIKQILQLKQRPVEKGLILIAANFAQLQPYVDLAKLTAEQQQMLFASWPGPVTWIVPKQPTVSPLLSGQFDSIAVRVTDHPLVQQLCQQFGKAIVSTSANLSGLQPAKTTAEVAQQFRDLAILNGQISGRDKPSEIRDSRSGKILRAG